MFVCEFHATFSCLDGSIASLRWQHSLPKDEVAMGTNSFFYIWLRQSVPALVVYPPFDAPHMLTCRGTRHHRTQSAFAGAIHCAGKHVFLAQCAHLCHHGICNEGHVFVLPRCVKGTANVHESIGCRVYIEDWSVASALPSVSLEASPYFLVTWGHDPHGLLLQTIIGRRQNCGCPSGPSGQNSIFPLPAGERDDGISTLRSHQYSLGTRGSLKKSNVKPLPSTASLHAATKYS